MVQAHGYNAFSYTDISSQVGTRKASFQYHFPNKSDLGREVEAQLLLAGLQDAQLATRDFDGDIARFDAIAQRC